MLLCNGDPIDQVAIRRKGGIGYEPLLSGV